MAMNKLPKRARQNLAHPLTPLAEYRNLLATPQQQ